ncbi:TetR/AcrR family transcriptional regulator [Profundibacter sp.]|uniref:TetR/AcrR family transcriptional regulator n=1 Tax=Profundibacter sp. TaxID=3101071 RepID=UPI003D1268EC
MKHRLSPTDWIQAAFRALTTGGPQAIRAESIARALKVSKGSFYWHFKDVPALKQTMLDHWQQVATQDVIDLVESGASDAKARLQLLMHISTALPNDAYGGDLAEAAIRDWARYDTAAANAVKAIDVQRLKFVETQFCALGFNPQQSKQRATILYAALIGLHQLSHHDLANPASDLPALLDHLLKP